MCFGNRSKVDESGLARSRELDKAIRADEKKMAKEVKLLLLGKSSWMFVPSDDKEPKLILFFCWRQGRASRASRQCSSK